VFAIDPDVIDVFVVDTTGGLAALALTDRLRAEGIRADRAYENRSMKSQMKAADKSGARYAVIIGSDEAASETALLRPLRDGGEQTSVAQSDLTTTLRKALS
jgi:histidyl-tRNA synthetase